MLGQPIVIENVAGAGGSIGVGRAVRAPADGYTLEMGTSTTHMLLGGLYPLPFDLINDLAPVLLIASEPLMIVGKKNLPANDLKELVAWLKANPGKASIGIPAVGGTGHLAGLSFLKADRHARPSSCPIAAAARRCKIWSAARSICRSSRRRTSSPRQGRRDQALCDDVEDPQRARRRDIPTTEEAGMPGFQASLWYGLWAPKGTPKDVVAQAQRRDARGAGDTRRRASASPNSAWTCRRASSRRRRRLRAFQKAEADKWWPIIKAANIKGQ